MLLEIDFSHPKANNMHSTFDLIVMDVPQVWICYKKMIGETIKEIRDQFEEHMEATITEEAILSCLTRSAKGLPWEKGGNQGADHYLCRKDRETLVDEVNNRARLNVAYDANDVVFRASQLKQERMKIAANILKLLGCRKTEAKFRMKIVKPPDRSWVNIFLNYCDSKLIYPTYIDNKRFMSCSREHVLSFFDKFEEILKNTPPELIFTADETMLQAAFSKKVCIPNDIRRYIESKIDGIPHMTAMCCANLLGKAAPLYLIIKNRMNFPEELLKIRKAALFGLGSTPSGWMNRFTFFYWVTHFIPFVTNYVYELGLNPATVRTVLIVDGHVSRSCPLALELLAANNVIVLTLPPHTTHILQVFDVSLAGPLKRAFTDLLREYICSKQFEIPGNEEATLRRCAFLAIVTAWQRACTIVNCVNGAEKVGIFPYNPERAANNEFVRELTREEQAIIANRRVIHRNFNINNQELTSPESIENIRRYLQEQGDDPILARTLREFRDYKDVCMQVFTQGRSVRSSQISRPPYACRVTFYGMFPGW